MALSIPAPAATAREWSHTIRERAKGLVARWQRVARIPRARAGYAASALSGVWGVGVLWGFGWALLVGGVVGAMSFLHLYPVDDQ